MLKWAYIDIGKVVWNEKIICPSHAYPHVWNGWLLPKWR